jgi:hypothetical protein
MSRLVSVNTQVLADPEKLLQPAACSASLHTTVTQGLSPCQLTLKTTTADALTLLLHNQHALAAALEGVIKWISENGVKSVAANPMGHGSAGQECTNHHRCDYAPTPVIGII